ncbi:hypothetical protein RJ640_017336 [Escallonia rubra]|uniref:Dirigent protein n=1 Tax=Escallonia rubra TaxID=112253 RepID=A0AA88U5K9_9ASTE|nr:hypothetical protein RJ640_017336 [Escallonia rubra]
MLPKIIFFAAVSLATLAVILLALYTPVPHRKPAKNSAVPSLALSLYIRQTLTASHSTHSVVPSASGAYVFHRALAEGPESTSRVVGKAQGFIIPVEHFAHSAFNVIYLTFNTHDYSGSLSVQARNVGHKDNEELTVVGGTGSFAFARGNAIFGQTDQQGTSLDVTYHIKLNLRFPNRSQTMPG